MTAGKHALFAAALVVTAIWPREGRVGTYGSFTLAQAGFTVAKDINVGSFSDHAREGDVLRDREAAIRAAVTPNLPLYRAWYQRALDGKHAYAGYLGALDRRRATVAQWDYKSRLLAPYIPVRGTRAGSPSLLGDPVDDAAQGALFYLHMRADQSPVRHGRALVGFALAQIALGDGPGFFVPSPIKVSVEQALDHAAHGDSYTGQARLVAELLLRVRAQQTDLAAFVADPTRAPELRLLGGLCLAALQHRPLGDADWQRVKEADQIDRRLVWTWLLVLGPAAEATAREASLRLRLPLSDGDSGTFYKEFLTGQSH